MKMEREGLEEKRRRRGVEERAREGQRAAQERLAVPGIPPAPLQGTRLTQDFPPAILREHSHMGVFSVGDARRHVGVRAWKDARGHLGVRASASSLGAATSPVSTSSRMTDALLTPSVGTLPASPQPPAGLDERRCHLEGAWAAQRTSRVPSLTPRASRAPSLTPRA